MGRKRKRKTTSINKESTSNMLKKSIKCKTELVTLICKQALIIDT